MSTSSHEMIDPVQPEAEQAATKAQFSADDNAPASDGLPSAAQAAFDAEVEHNYKHNFIVNALDGACYWFGFSFISPTTILPLYVSHFTKDPLVISLISLLNSAGFLLPQLFTSNFVERAPRKKIFPVNVGFFTERLPVMVMALTAALFAEKNPTLALTLFLIAYAWYTFGAGLIIVGWQDMIGKIIPVDRRGRFFGITNFAGNASGILGALAVPFVLEKFPFPQGFVFAFTAAAILIFLSWVSLSLAKEPAQHTSKPTVSQLDYLRSLPTIIRKDHNFLRYLIFQIVLSFSMMGAGFLIVFSAQHWNLSDSFAGGFIFAQQVGQTVANPIFGVLADKKGHKLCLEISALISAGSFLFAFLAPDPLWFYPIFFLRGVIFAANFISATSIVLEFTGPQDRPTYIGLANTIPGIAGSIAPLLGGGLALVSGYPVMFLLSAVIGLGSFGLLRWTVYDPRHALAPA